MKEKPFISVVVYLYNNEDEIAHFLKSIDSILHKNFENYEVIMVNDASTDKTFERVKEAIQNISADVSIINLTRKHNVEIAMMAGTDKSIGDYVFEMDSPIIDYPMELVFDIYKKAIGGYDIVAAVPNVRIAWTSKLFYALINKFSYWEINLTPESFRIVSRRALNSILNITEKTRYRKGIHSYIGFLKTKVRYDKINKKSAIMKRNIYDKIVLGLDILISFTNIANLIAIYLSVILLFFSIGIGIYALYSLIFLENIAGSGWASIISFLSIAFSGIFFILGIVSNYTSKILIEVQNRPLYNIKSIEMHHSEKL